MLHFLDFKISRSGDWTCSIFNFERKCWVDTINEPARLSLYYKMFKDEIFIGYNIKSLQQYLFRAVISGIDPLSVLSAIESGVKPWDALNSPKTVMNIYEVQLNKDLPIEHHAACMGFSVEDSIVDLNAGSQKTEEELRLMVEESHKNVEWTMHIFFEKIEDFNAHLSLITAFSLPLSDISKTKSRLAAKILDCERTEFNDGFNIEFVPVLKISKYKNVLEFFNNKKDYSESLDVNIAGVPHRIGWGGIHGAKRKFHSEAVEGKSRILHIDAEAYYPSLMLKYGFLPRGMKSPEKYKAIYDKRIELKSKGLKKQQKPYKIVLNAVSGCMKDKNSQAYDEKMSNCLYANGQLLFIDLVEKFESIGSFSLIQSNTDGLIMRVMENDYEDAVKICREWEERTGLNLSISEIKSIWQKDVNNYVYTKKLPGGSVEIVRRGEFVKEYSKIDNDVPVVSRAIVEYMVNGTPVEATINGAKHLVDFQKIVRAYGDFDCITHSGGMSVSRVHRVFASKLKDGTIYKQVIGSGASKLTGAPDNCFVEDGDIRNRQCPVRVDRTYYINMAKKRLEAFCQQI